MIRRPPRSTRTSHSFPTRRSSDLYDLHPGKGAGANSGKDHAPDAARRCHSHLCRRIEAPRTDRLSAKSDAGGRLATLCRLVSGPLRNLRLQAAPSAGRSEEHTSELQSLMRISYAVFCLKKKKNRQTQPTTKQN